MFFYSCPIREGSKKKAKWTPEEEAELQRLYEEHKDSGGGVTLILSVWRLVFKCDEQSLNDLSASLLLSAWCCWDDVTFAEQQPHQTWGGVTHGVHGFGGQREGFKEREVWFCLELDIIYLFIFSKTGA